MANTALIRQILANLPQAPGVPPLTPSLTTPPTFPSALGTLPPPMPPPAPEQSLDPTIRALIMSQLPPPPTAPIQQPAGKLEQLAAILGGVSAGIQGRGPEYGAFLREQRERPRREYERKLETYNQERGALGLRATEAQLRDAERRRERQERVAERQAERDFQEWVRKTGVEDQLAIEKMREAFQLQRQREAERIADEKLAAQQEQQKKIKLAELASKYRQLGAKEYASELAQKDLDPNFKLSRGAEKWESAKVALDNARAARAAAGGASGGAEKIQTFAELADGSVVPLTPTVADAAKLGAIEIKRVYSPQLQKQTAPQSQPQIEPGLTGMLNPANWLNMSVPGAQAKPTPNIKRAEAKRKLVREGYSSKEADAELNRLGIK